MRTNATGTHLAVGAGQLILMKILVRTQTVGYGWGTYIWGDSTWGTERSTSTVTLAPGNWSLDNFGEVLVATIFNGKTFTWNAGAANPRTIELFKYS